MLGRGFKIGLLMVVTCGPGSRGTDAPLDLRWREDATLCHLQLCPVVLFSAHGREATWEWSGGTNGDLFPMVLAWGV